MKKVCVIVLVMFFFGLHNLAGEIQCKDTLEVFKDNMDQMISQNVDSYSVIPHNKSVEFIRQPHTVNINTNEPVYSWNLPDEAIYQTAYQILVASSQENINNNRGDVWDSGKVISDRSASVKHEGELLEPDGVYYWKVRIWNENKRLSEYSKAQKINTGSFDGFVSTSNTFENELIPPKKIIKTGKNKYFVDFGKAAFGTLTLDYSAKQKDTLVVRLGEKQADHSIDMDPGGTIRSTEVELPVNPAQNEYKPELTPDERNTSKKAVQLPDSFDVIMPFRYVEIENYQETLKPEDIKQKAYYGYFEDDESHFISSDTVLNQVWDLCKYSIKATSFAGYYIDGDRERIPYEADAYINQLSHYGVDAEYAIGRQTAEYFMKNPTWPTEWSLHTAMLLYQDYYYTSNTKLIETYYEDLKHKSLSALAREDGLISTSSDKHNGELMNQLGFADSTKRLRDIVDWPAGERDGYDMVSVNTVVNCFFYHNMVLMAEFADILNKSEDKNYYEYMAAKVKKAINDKLFDAKKGIYVDGEGSKHSALHANMMPLAFGIVPEEHQESVVEFVKSRGMACSVYGAQYLLDGLYEAGEASYALDLLRATHERSWWNMIAVGSTITLEAWDMKYKTNLDWNHAWGAVPANIIPRRLWGVTPKVPGFDVIKIQPQLGDLKFSTIEVPTIKGAVKGAYEKISNLVQKYKIEIPANAVGEFYLDDVTPGDDIFVNGEKINPGFEFIRLEAGINDIIKEH